MKKYIIGVLLVFSTFSYAVKDLKTMKTLKFNTEEKQIINGKEKVLKYEVSIEFPNKIRKEMTFPELNKGEIYVYDGENKITYLPIFDEYRQEKIDGNENKVIQAINKIRNLENSSSTKKEYQAKKLKRLYIDENKNIEIGIKEYLEKDEYILPKNIEIKDSGVKLGTVFIKDVEVNPVLDSKIFKIDQWEKWFF